MCIETHNIYSNKITVRHNMAAYITNKNIFYLHNSAPQSLKRTLLSHMTIIT